MLKPATIAPLLEVELLKECMRLWRDANVEVIMLNYVKKTRHPHHFWKLSCWKSACGCGAKHMSKSKCQKGASFKPLLDVQPSLFCGKRNGFCTLPQVSKMWGYCSSFKNDGRRGNFEESLQRCSLGGMRNAKDISTRHVRRSRPGRRFPEMGCILEHYIIIRLAKMILVDRCSTSYDPAPLLPGRRSTLDRWGGKIAKRIGTKPSALHSTFHFWRKYRRIASFLDVVNVEK